MQTACLRDANSTFDGWLGRKQWFVVGDGIPGNPKTRWFSQTGTVVQKTTCWSKAAKGWRGAQTIESSAHRLDDTHKSVKCNKHKSRSACIMDMWTLVKSPLHSGPNTAGSVPRTCQNDCRHAKCEPSTCQNDPSTCQKWPVDVPKVTRRRAKSDLGDAKTRFLFRLILPERENFKFLRK